MGAGFEISFIDRETEVWLRREAPDDGLCLKKFKADIIVDNLCTLPEGSVICSKGESYIITKKGKRCFEECELLKRTGRPCPLASGVAFGERTESI